MCSNSSAPQSSNRGSAAQGQEAPTRSTPTPMVHSSWQGRRRYKR